MQLRLSVPCPGLWPDLHRLRSDLTQALRPLQFPPGRSDWPETVLQSDQMLTAAHPWRLPPGFPPHPYILSAIISVETGCSSSALHRYLTDLRRTLPVPGHPARLPHRSGNHLTQIRLPPPAQMRRCLPQPLHWPGILLHLLQKLLRRPALPDRYSVIGLPPPVFSLRQPHLFLRHRQIPDGCCRPWHWLRHPLTVLLHQTGSLLRKPVLPRRC